MTERLISADADNLQGRFGGAVAALLNRQAADLPHDFSERLRAGREQALVHARRAPALARQVQVAPSVVGRTRGGTALLGGPPSWGLKLASGLPLLLLVAGLLLIDRLNGMQQVRAAAEIDTMLLADDLPPVAYTDPGFGEFLRTDHTVQP